jgi:hypothetical protein
MCSSENALSRVRKKLMSCHSRHVIYTELDKKFRDYLVSGLKVDQK